MSEPLIWLDAVYQNIHRTLSDVAGSPLTSISVKMYFLLCKHQALLTTQIIIVTVSTIDSVKQNSQTVLET